MAEEKKAEEKKAEETKSCTEHIFKESNSLLRCDCYCFICHQKCFRTIMDIAPDSIRVTPKLVAFLKKAGRVFSGILSKFHIISKSH